METYRQMMLWSWEETKSNSPQYFERMQYAVLKCRGRVLEIGCGIGTMTKFISMSKKVTEIVAIDAFPEAIEELKTYNLPKFTALQIPLEEIKFDNTRKFDTVILCEIIEHIFPDQEMKMLHALKPYINAKTIYIVSTPIGWLEDPHHVRGFSKRNLKRHLKRFYGEPIDIDYSAEYSQSAFGYFNKATLDTN
jgi:2-polyprenyl-3-methyl-5-hydroxy-6-metoxy-1,4-benzoquinol methylase